VDLILWRHAEAQLLQEGQVDLDRRLTAAGERQARRMGLWLQQRLPSTTKVLVSPAARTLATADALERRYRVDERLAPDQPPETLLETAGWPDAPQPVLLVGHQPTLGRIAALLLAELDAPWSFKKGSVWWIRSRLREGLRQTVLHAVMAPDLIGHKP
jgi:phosphohistidine phosphatase